MVVYTLRSEQLDDGFWRGTIVGMPEVSAYGMSSWYAMQRAGLLGRRLLREKGRTEEELADVHFWPKRYPECECGAQTAYCDWTDREYCPRCDQWLTEACRCPPGECWYFGRDRPRPSDCPHCASVIAAQRALYGSDPSYTRPERGMIWCKAEDGTVCCVAHRAPECESKS
jgi:hypothetical protein